MVYIANVKRLMRNAQAFVNYILDSFLKVLPALTSDYGSFITIDKDFTDKPFCKAYYKR